MADIGDRILVRFTITDLEGVPTDPITIDSHIYNVSTGVSSPITLTHTGTGKYEGPYDIAQSGEHWVRAETTGPVVVAGEKRFVVVERRVPIFNPPTIFPDSGLFPEHGLFPLGS